MPVVELLSLICATGIPSVFVRDLAKILVHAGQNLKAPDPEINQKLHQLERKLLKIQSHVDDAEKKASMSSISNAYQIIIEDFKNILLDGEDLVDKTLFEYERIHSQQLRPAKLEKHLKSFEAKLGKEIGDMVEKANGLALEMEGYTISELSQPWLAQTSCASDQNIRGSLVDHFSVVGREKDKLQLMDLVHKRNKNVVSVISIVGMVGIGKTTLAQLLFSEPKLVEELSGNTANKMWWVSVSFGDDALKITKSICESTTKTVPDSSIAQLTSLDSVQLKLKQILGETEKFMLVLDGMSDENFINWDTLLLPFRFAAPGSIIVVTTRSQVVSSIVTDGSSTYSVSVLPDKDCLEIINSGLKSCLSDERGLHIAEKCKGIPLVAKLIRNAIRLRSRHMEWDEILRCEHWNLSEDNNVIYPVLKHGYDQLPAYLKRCFAYSSILPRNRPFQREELIQLWAAEGFIEAHGTRRIEDIGREYFDELCSKSFFQVSSENPNKGKYEMHGFIHDLAKIVSTNLCFASEGTKPQVFPVTTNLRHSSICDENIEPGTLKEFYKYQKLRTFMLLSKFPERLHSVPDDFFRRFPCLRVLNLSGTRISKLSGDIKLLRHLRHLNVSGTLIIKFPQDIDQLRGLERLNVKNCSKLEELPENLNKLIKLRHIDLDKLGRVISMPVYIGKLTSLETLSVFVVGSEGGTTIEELKEMTCLRGSICIQKLEKVNNEDEAKSAKLQEKQYLEELELQWTPRTIGTNDQAILEGLKPHPSLSKLQVMGYHGLKFPDWMSNPSFCKLSTINLRNCSSCTLLPSLGGLPFLKYLVIEDMRSLKKVDDRFFQSDGRLFQVGFPSLETLKFSDMPALNSWDGLEAFDMPCLRKLVIVACRELRNLPELYKLTALNELEVDGCPELQSFTGDELPKSLKKLIILESDNLKQQYCTINAHNWNKISYVGHIETDDGIIQSL